MHELSLCQNLIDQLTALNRQHGGQGVGRVELRAGPLSGVDPQLLETAFLMAREGTVAATAELALSFAPARVACQDCGREADVASNDLRCPFCQGSATELIGGDELILSRVELLRDDLST